MKRVLILAAIVLAGIGMTVAAACRETPDSRAEEGASSSPNVAQGPSPAVAEPKVAEIQKVRENLYLLTGGGGNTAAFITAAGVVLVDTKLPGWGPAILEKLRTVTDRPVTTIINTHSHLDHVGSNDFFPAEVEIVAHENTRARMGRMPAVKDKPLAMPDRTFGDRLTLGEGAEQIDLYHFGAGHTDGDALVVFPALRVLHAGDFFPGREAPTIDVGGGGSVVAYPDTLARATKTLRNIDAIIPGHAPVMAWADLQDFEEFNREFVAAARAAHKAGKTPEQAMAELELSAKFSTYNMRRAAANMLTIFAELSR